MKIYKRTIAAVVFSKLLLCLANTDTHLCVDDAPEALTLQLGAGQKQDTLKKGHEPKWFRVVPSASVNIPEILQRRHANVCTNKMVQCPVEAWLLATTTQRE